jgi:hypothetical protein
VAWRSSVAERPRWCDAGAVIGNEGAAVAAGLATTRRDVGEPDAHGRVVVRAEDVDVAAAVFYATPPQRWPRCIADALKNR